MLLVTRRDSGHYSNWRRFVNASVVLALNDSRATPCSVAALNEINQNRGQLGELIIIHLNFESKQPTGGLGSSQISIELLTF